MIILTVTHQVYILQIIIPGRKYGEYECDGGSTGTPHTIISLSPKKKNRLCDKHHVQARLTLKRDMKRKVNNYCIARNFQGTKILQLAHLYKSSFADYNFANEDHYTS